MQTDQFSHTQFVMNENTNKEEISTPAITVTRSMVHKGKTAKKGHAFFTVKHKDPKNNAVATLVQEFKTEGLSEIGELALKGKLVKEFRQHFKI